MDVEMINVTNVTDTDTDGEDVAVPKVLQYTITAVLVLLIFTGGIGNLLTFLVVILNKNFRKHMIYILIANQSFGDMILLFLLGPIKIYSLVTLQSPGILLCGMEEFGSTWMINATALCILFTGVYRYIQIVHPRHYWRVDNNKMYVWMAPLLVLVPGMSVGQNPRIYYDKFTIRCVMLNEDLWNIISNIQLVLFYIPEVFITPLFYLSIIVKVKKAQKRVGMETIDVRVPKKDNILTKTTFAVFGIFFVFYTIPGIIAMLTQNLDIRVNMMVRVIYFVIVRMPPFLNVLIYIALNRKMRDGYRRFICPEKNTS